MPTLLNEKIFRPILRKKFLLFFANFRANFFCPKSAEMKILLWNVGMGNKLYEMNFFDLCCQKLKIMKQIPLFKKVFFLKGARFSDFIETRLSSYKPLVIRYSGRFLSIRFKPHQAVVPERSIFSTMIICTQQKYLVNHLISSNQIKDHNRWSFIILGNNNQFWQRTSVRDIWKVK